MTEVKEAKNLDIMEEKKEKITINEERRNKEKGGKISKGRG